MSAELTPEDRQRPPDIPEDVLLTNMIVYHAYNMGRVKGAVACKALIEYDSPDPVSTLSLSVDYLPKPKRAFWRRERPEAPGAYRNSSVFHPPGHTGNYFVDAYSFRDIDIKRPGKPEATPEDVPTGIYVISADVMNVIGRPDLSRAERHLLRSTLYAPYFGQFVLRQDTFEACGRQYRRAAKASTEEVRRLHDCMGGRECTCSLMVRLNHFGPLSTYGPLNLASDKKVQP